MNLVTYLPVMGPFIGVVVGWTLNEFSFRFKDSMAVKRTLSKTITYLTILHDDVSALGRTLRRLKSNIGSTEAYELERIRLVERNLFSSDAINQQFDICVQEVASLSSLDAIELHQVKDILEEYKKINLTASSNNQSIYKNMLLNLELAYNTSEQKLDGIALRLARRHSLITWFQLKRRQRDNQKKIELAEPNQQEWFEKMMEESGKREADKGVS